MLNFFQVIFPPPTTSIHCRGIKILLLLASVGNQGMDLTSNLLPLTAQSLDKIYKASALRHYTAGSTETRWGQKKGEPCNCPACGPKAASGLESREEGEELTVRLGGGMGVDSWLRWVLEPPEPWSCRGWERGRRKGGKEGEQKDLFEV